MSLPPRGTTGGGKPGIPAGRRAQYSAAVDSDASIRFFDTQFQRQVRESDLRLNRFEAQALPWLHGRVLDYGCGLGNLALAAARGGCSVLALDASATAIDHLQRVAGEEHLPLQACLQDLRTYAVAEDFDAVVSIGLLMFFDCPTAWRQLHSLQEHVRPGGIAVINVLVEGTTYLDMFDPQGHCLFGPQAVRDAFAGWDILSLERQDFPAPHDSVKAFATIVARKPRAAA